MGEGLRFEGWRLWPDMNCSSSLPRATSCFSRLHARSSLAVVQTVTSKSSLNVELAEGSFQILSLPFPTTSTSSWLDGASSMLASINFSFKFLTSSTYEPHDFSLHCAVGPDRGPSRRGPSVSGASSLWVYSALLSAECACLSPKHKMHRSYVSSGVRNLRHKGIHFLKHLVGSFVQPRATQTNVSWRQKNLMTFITGALLYLRALYLWCHRLSSANKLVFITCTSDNGHTDDIPNSVYSRHGVEVPLQKGNILIFLFSANETCY